MAAHRHVGHHADESTEARSVNRWRCVILVAGLEHANANVSVQLLSLLVQRLASAPRVLFDTLAHQRLQLDSACDCLGACDDLADKLPDAEEVTVVAMRAESKLQERVAVDTPLPAAEKPQVPIVGARKGTLQVDGDRALPPAVAAGLMRSLIERDPQQC